MKAPFPQILITPLSSIFLAGLCLSGGRALAECNFSDLSKGVFGTPVTRNQGWLESASVIGGQGTSATVTIDCDEASQVSAAIHHVATPATFNFSAAASRAIIRYSTQILNIGDSGFSPGSSDWSQGSNANIVISANTPAAFDISLVVGFDDNRILPAGNYRYGVTLTVTPN